ncbi:MAG: T9SS type A sorting domain-containing protein [Bacteroidota bacterium]
MAFVSATAATQAQSITNYTFAPSSGTYSALSGSTAVDAIEADVAISGAIPIGFTFYYMGMPYTNVYAGSDGYLSFNSSATATGSNNLTTSAAALRPLVAPLWDDLSGATTGAASYITTGTSPNRVFTFEWLNWKWNFGASGAVLSFQAKLYESNGRVEFVYLQNSTAINGTPTASIGITATATGSGNFLSLNNSTSTATASSTTATTNIATKPADGQTFTFTPNQSTTPAVPKDLTFTTIGATGFTLNFKDSSTTETYFIVSRSTDGTTFSQISTIASTTTATQGTTYNLAQTGLAESTTYYYRITANNEASPASSNLTGSQATAAGSLTGTKTINPGGSGADNYVTFTAAIAALNFYGAASGGVTFNVITATTFNESPLTITWNATSAAPVVFQRDGSGTNPVLSGTGGVGTADFILTLSGADYITFDGIDLKDNASNSSPTLKMERGLYLLGTATNGCKNNTYKNGVITLDKTNTNATYCVSLVSAATETSGTNTSNYFYNNTVQNARHGYYFDGISTTFPDDDNRIGTTGSGVSKVYNLGNGANITYGVYGLNQTNMKVFSTNIRNLSNTSTLYGIYSSGTTSTFEFYNNRIDSMSNTSTLYGIYNVSAETVSIYSDTLNALSTTSTLYGIYLSGATTSNAYSNIITNLSNTSTSSTSALYGIIASSSATHTSNIYLNTINGLSHAGTSTGSIYGLSVTTAAANNVYRNNINNISNSTTTTGISYGLAVQGGTINRIHNNFIYDIRANASTGAPGVRALNISGGTSDSVYYNTVYLNATPTVASHQSAALYLTATPANVELKNNIFVNNNASTNITSGRVVAFYRSTTTYTNHTTTSSNNLFYAGTPGTTRLIFYDGTNSDQTLSAMKSRLTPRESNSVTEMPPFISATGTINVHLSSGTATQAESGGIAITGYTDDYDASNIRTGYPLSGQTNGGGTAPDIGADEGDFIPLDITGPTITYTPAVNVSSTSNRTLSSFAAITDVNGVNTTSGTRPRLYYKKSGDANTYAGNTSADNGFKYVEASNTSSPFSFTLDYSLLRSTVIAGDVIQYFVVAQDLVTTPNVGITTGTFAATPASVALTSGAFPIGGTLNSYTISTGISGTKTVGTGGDYTTLTGTGGAFEAVNNTFLSGNLTLSIITNLTEDGTNALNQFAEEGGTGYTITIQPSETTEKLIAGAVANGMIRLNGADRVKIDGRSGGAGQYLRIRNTNTSNPTITLQNDATANAIRYSIIEGANTTTTSGVILISTSTGTTGNDNDTIANNDIRDLSSATGVPANAIYASGTIDAMNSSNIIQNNKIYNWTSNGISISGTGNGDSWNISSNSFYQTAARTTALMAINVMSGTNGSGHTINNNSIGGATSTRTGVATSTTSTGYGIQLSVGTVTTTSVQGNTISNISTGTAGFKGISVTGGNVDIGTTSGNIIGGAASSSDTIRVGFDSEMITNTGSSTVNIQNNTIGNIEYVDASGDRLAGIFASAGTVTIKKNTIRNLKSNGNSTGFTYILSGIYLSSNGSGSSVDSNNIYTLQHTNTSTSAYNTAGIYIQDVPTGTTVTKNRIYDINASGTGTGTSSARVWGIYSASGSATYANNMISIGNNVTNEVRVGGIEDAGTGTNNWYFNSVYVTGTTATGVNSSYAFQRTGSATVTLRNNIFYNVRTTQGTGKNYAIANTASTPSTGWSSTASDYNVLYVANAPLGIWGTTDQTDIAAWRTASGGDANSKSITVTFAGAATGDLHLAGSSIGDMNLMGTSISGVTVDYDNESRTGSPYIGADERTDSPLPVELTNFDITAHAGHALLTWKTASETNNAGFEVWRSLDNAIAGYSRIGAYTVYSELKGLGSDPNGKHYSFTDENYLEKGYTYWYKLISVDEDGIRSEFEPKSIEILDGVPALSLDNMMPNPANDFIMLQFSLADATSVTVEIFDAKGQLVLTPALGVVYKQGANGLQIPLEGLPTGSYRAVITGLAGRKESQQFVIVR